MNRAATIAAAVAICLTFGGQTAPAHQWSMPAGVRCLFLPGAGQ